MRYWRWCGGERISTTGGMKLGQIMRNEGDASDQKNRTRILFVNGLRLIVLTHQFWM